MFLKTRSTTPHKRLRNERSKIVNRVTLQPEKSVHLQIDNVTILTHSEKMEETRKAELNKIVKKILEELNCELDHTYCRIPPKPSTHRGGLRVIPYHELERVEIVPSGISKDK